MAWVRLDDDFFDHPKIAPLSDRAFRLWVCSIGYCGRHLTDGYLSAQIAPALLPGKGVRGVIQELVLARLWEETEGGFNVHHYLNYNPTAAKVKGERDAAKQRMSARRSPEQSANNRRTIGEQTANVREKFGDPVPVPVYVYDVPGNIPRDVPRRSGEVRANADPVPVYDVPRDARSDNLGEIWASVLESLRGEMSQANWSTWFGETVLLSLGETAVVGGGSAYQIETLQTRMVPLVARCLREHCETVVDCQFVLLAPDG